MAQSSGDAVAGIIFLIIIGVLCLVGLVLYFLPTIVAHRMKRKNRVPITLLNIFVGWTFFGWVGTMVWACLDDQPSTPAAYPPPQPPPAYTPPPPPPPNLPAAAPGVRYCTACGTASPEGMRFCSRCGQALA